MGLGGVDTAYGSDSKGRGEVVPLKDLLLGA
jgi:hypothetical protein